MYELPTSIEIGGRQFNIRNKGDYRVILDCITALRDDELSEDERIFASLLIFYNEFTYIEDVPTDEDTLMSLVKEMFKFISYGDDDDSIPGAVADHTVVDWEKDEKIIVSAINNVAKKEIRAEKYVHWWTFMGYYLAIGESLFATVASIRLKIAKHEKLEKWEQKFKKDNPHYFVWRDVDLKAKEAQDILSEIWNKEG